MVFAASAAFAIIPVVLDVVLEVLELDVVVLVFFALLPELLEPDDELVFFDPELELDDEPDELELDDEPPEPVCENSSVMSAHFHLPPGVNCT